MRPLTLDDSLRGRVVLITGAAIRLGAYLAEGLAEQGAIVAINHLGLPVEAERLRRDLEVRGHRARCYEADISDPAACVVMAQQVVEDLGRIDVLIHNASSFVKKPFLEIDFDDYSQAMDVNLKGPFFLTQAVARHMLERGQGKVIAIIGNSVHEAWAGGTIHSVSKAALLRLMETISVELAPMIQAAAISPGQVLVSEHGMPVSVSDSLPIGQPKDVLDAVEYICRSTAFLNGAHLVVDGGRSLC